MTFEVETDARKNRIIVTLTGFATLETVRRFEADFRRALDRLSPRRGAHQLIYDVSRAKIQSQDVVDALRQLALHSPRTSAFALVNASALAGRQLRRIFDGMEVQICRERQSAIDWLDAQKPAVGIDRP